MVGEFLREAGVLLAVFIPLDMLFSAKALATKTLLSSIAVCLLCLISGVAVERMRP
jgi:hypothetical protein